jgi:hypothetical protein
VNGWFAVSQRTPAGIESAGTNALDRNGSRNWIARLIRMPGTRKSKYGCA